ncbi:MAG: hypothetical protein A2142_08225 [candidate division Zixibacteria bacterium RBG_16_48_11]|nr:MAG: hypothetical protein A2142_08225 [candidate division Zixibacteria bacterium RBG_16_48_11]
MTLLAPAPSSAESFHLMAMEWPLSLGVSKAWTSCGGAGSVSVSWEKAVRGRATVRRAKKAFILWLIYNGLATHCLTETAWEGIWVMGAKIVKKKSD